MLHNIMNRNYHEWFITLKNVFSRFYLFVLPCKYIYQRTRCALNLCTKDTMVKTHFASGIHFLIPCDYYWTFKQTKNKEALHDIWKRDVLLLAYVNVFWQYIYVSMYLWKFNLELKYDLEELVL